MGRCILTGMANFHPLGSLRMFKPITYNHPNNWEIVNKWNSINQSNA